MGRVRVGLSCRPCRDRVRRKRRGAPTGRARRGKGEFRSRPAGGSSVSRFVSPSDREKGARSSTLLSRQERGRGRSVVAVLFFLPHAGGLTAVGPRRGGGEKANRRSWGNRRSRKALECTVGSERQRHTNRRLRSVALMEVSSVLECLGRQRSRVPARSPIS